MDRVRSEVDEFLRRFTIEAYYEKGRDRFGEKFPKMTGDWGGGLLLEVSSCFTEPMSGVSLKMNCWPLPNGLPAQPMVLTGRLLN